MTGISNSLYLLCNFPVNGDIIVILYPHCFRYFAILYRPKVAPSKFRL